MRKIRKIIIHCSATPEGKDCTVEEIRRWHTMPVAKGGRGWRDIGYHYVIYRDGSIHKGRPVVQVGSHCKGHNNDSIGICYIGGLTSDGKTPKDTRTDAQKQSLKNLVATLRSLYPGITLHGHNEFNAAKACPSYSVEKELKNKK